MSAYAIQDAVSALGNVRSWAYMASKQIQVEYRRSLMGRLWIMVAFGVTAAGIGSLMAQLQGRPMAEHVPYVMFGLAIWNYVSAMITAGCSVLTNARPYLLQMPLSRSVFVLSLMLRNLYLMGMQLGTAVAVSLVLGWRPDWHVLWAFPALGLYVVAGFGAAMFLGHLCARVPDFSPPIGAVMRLCFFFTPVIWVAGSRGDGGLIGFLVQWNPFTHVLLSFRDGFLGQTPSLLNWSVMGVIALLCLVLGLGALQILGRRITYWV